MDERAESSWDIDAIMKLPYQLFTYPHAFIFVIVMWETT